MLTKSVAADLTFALPTGSPPEGRAFMNLPGSAAFLRYPVFRGVANAIFPRPCRALSRLAGWRAEVGSGSHCDARQHQHHQRIRAASQDAGRISHRIVSLIRGHIAALRVETGRHLARCDLADYFINELGARPQDGFANRPWDNVGVQYGLNALMSGAITAAQFVDINLKIGSRDIDYNPISPRVAADPPSIPVAYQGGLFNEGNNMTIPILDLRGHDIEEIHHDYRSYVMRARLDKANGNHNNQIMDRTDSAGRR